jgi:hypothetical protein
MGTAVLMGIQLLTFQGPSGRHSWAQDPVVYSLQDLDWGLGFTVSVIVGPTAECLW